MSNIGMQAGGKAKMLQTRGTGLAAGEDMVIAPISADSHITEPPNCFIDNIERRYRHVAPRIEVVVGPSGPEEAYVIEGTARSVSLGLVAAAGRDPATLSLENNGTFSQLHRGGWDPVARLTDQDRDGVAAEFIYPSVGMVVSCHPDGDYKNACMWAYNRWLQEFVSAAPDRLFGLGMTAVRNVPEAIEDFRRIKEMGFKGVMMPGYPVGEKDYDDPIFDPLWRAAVELQLPLSFHILTMERPGQMLTVTNVNRGPKINGWQSIIRGCQDIIGLFIFGRIFERHPELKLVSVESDAGWAPHYMYRMDHAYKRHRTWMKMADMEKLPSEYFMENVYLTFQDDWIAFRMTNMCNPKRLMWANDFPHSDSTWPFSQELLKEHTKTLSFHEKKLILRDNVSELYNLTI